MINKEYWKKVYFSEDHFPEMFCPNCGKGLLKRIEKTLHFEETSHSKESRNHEDWDPDWIEERFIVMFKCSSKKCDDVTSCLGTVVMDHNMAYISELDDWNDIYIQTFRPIYFFPPLNLIPVADNLPKELKLELQNSFSHFFSDLPSCANKIRICIEILMDHLGVANNITNKGKIHSLSLHRRILEYKKINIEVADYLLAIKWIGNSGSHFDNLTKDDILDAYMILEYSLDKIYNDPEKIIRALSNNINKHKVAPSKIKKSGI